MVPAWFGALIWPAAAVGLLVLVRLGWLRWRRAHRPPVSELERWVRWVGMRWGWTAQNLGLVRVDETTRGRYGSVLLERPRKLPPDLIWPRCDFQPAPYGLRGRLVTVPGVGLDEVSRVAGHLANAWGCLRVEVRQDAPGVLELRGITLDPLARPWPLTPTGEALQDWELHVGVDSDGSHVLLPLSNLSGVTVAGVPGTGKTSLQRWWLCQLAPHPAVQVAVLDGKVSDPLDGDYGALAGRCFATAGDDLGDANRLLERLWETMRARSAWLRANRGTAQFWEYGPSQDCPLLVVVVDESHTYVTGASRKDRELCDSNVWYLTKLAKEGRSRGVVTVFVTQKQTADAIPTAIRDVCQVGISFGVRTMDGAVAALGDDIRQYPELAPTGLIGRQWTGVAVMRLPDRAGFHRVRTPYVTEGDAGCVIACYARLTATPQRGGVEDEQAA